MRSYEMTPEQIAPHQVRVRTVRFVKESQEITGDRWMTFAAPDGEIVEVRTACGAYAPREPVWPERQARRYAVYLVNRTRRARAERLAAGQPVTCQLTPTGGWPAD